MSVIYSDEEDKDMHDCVDSMLGVITLLGAILARALEAGLVTITEQAEIVALQATFIGIYQRINEREAREDSGNGPSVSDL